MGFFLSKLWKRLSGQSDDPLKVVVVGMPNSGKTTILYKLSLGEVIVTQPTIGSNVEEVSHQNLKMQVWDLGGQENLRSHWDTYYQNAQAVIYVIDSADKERLEVAKQELELMLQEEELRGAPVLVLANKQDLPGAMNE